MARYRCGDYAGAVQILSRSDELRQKEFATSQPCDVAFLAMSGFRLNELRPAKELLETLRTLAVTDRWRDDEDCQTLLDEVAALLAGDQEPQPPSR